jgi:hypothetical protein
MCDPARERPQRGTIDPCDEEIASGVDDVGDRSLTDIPEHDDVAHCRERCVLGRCCVL